MWSSVQLVKYPTDETACVTRLYGRACVSVAPVRVMQRMYDLSCYVRDTNETWVFALGGRTAHARQARLKQKIANEDAAPQA